MLHDYVFFVCINVFAQSLLDGSSYGRHDVTPTLFLQPWCCNCQVVSLDIPIQRTHLEFWSRRTRAFRWWSHDVCSQCKNDAVLQLWFCNCHVVRLDLPIQWRKYWVLVLKNKTFRWWSRGWLDEKFRQPCAKSFLDGSSYGRHDAKPMLFRANLILQLSSRQLGHANPTKKSWVLIS